MTFRHQQQLHASKYSLTFSPDGGRLVDEILVLFDGAALATSRDFPLDVRLAT